MRPQVIAVLAFCMLLPGQVKGQGKDSSDKAWPSLGSSEDQSRFIRVDRPRFIIESSKLQQAPVERSPSWVPRCATSSDGCVHIRLGHFFSEWKGSVERSTLRPGLIMHHYAYALFDFHFQSTGTYVFYLPEQKIFYLWGDCGMGHADVGQGPYAGDPRVVLKKLAQDPESIAKVGYLSVPFRTHRYDLDSQGEPWPDLSRVVIDTSKLERAHKVINPLSLDRCRKSSSEECVVTLRDFISQRKKQSGYEREVTRSDVLVHYYPSVKHQDAQRGVLKFETYVFYLPKRNIFYLGGTDSELKSDLILGPFANDPRVVLPKLAEAQPVQ